MNSVTVLSFWAQWCGPCRLMHPIVDDLKKSYDVTQIEVDKDTETAAQYSVKAVPTFVLLKNGEEVDRLVGAVSHSKLEEWIKSYGG